MGCVPENKKHKGFEEPVYKPKNPHFVRNITDCFRQMVSYNNQSIFVVNINKNNMSFVCFARKYRQLF